MNNSNEVCRRDLFSDAISESFRQ